MAALAADDVNNTPAKLDALQQAARAHDVELSIHRVTKAEEIAVVIDSAHTSGATALNILASPLFFTHAHLIMERATAVRIPVMFFFPEEAEEGAFAAYGPSLNQLFLGVTTQQIIRLLHGTKVAEIPVEQPTKFELVSISRPLRRWV